MVNAVSFSLAYLINGFLANTVFIVASCLNQDLRQIDDELPAIPKRS